jgi:predicted RNA binding protein YcfA (HicA-like mRNA interferase family)
MSKNVSEIVEQLEAQGFRCRTTRKGHIMVYAPEGHVVTTLPSTPSDTRSLKNAIAVLRRAGFQWKGR